MDEDWTALHYPGVEVEMDLSGDETDEDDDVFFNIIQNVGQDNINYGEISNNRERVIRCSTRKNTVNDDDVFLNIIQNIGQDNIYYGEISNHRTNNGLLDINPSDNEVE